MDRKIYAIFVAGGSGTRMGSSIPKQFIELEGIPVLQRTISRFVEAVPGLKVITVLPAGSFQTWKNLCAVHSFDCPQTLVAGGITRFHSVRNALMKVPDGAVVMIHDGVRPFVSAGLLNDMLERMESARAVIPVTPMTDTLKSLVPEEGGGFVCAGPDPDRSRVWGAQTPQVFLSEDIRRAYDQAFDTSFTDDASVAARNEIPLSYIRGERFNIKITTPEDLVFAKAILQLP